MLGTTYRDINQNNRLAISLFLQGANQAAAASNLGYPTKFVGQVGKDAYAPMLRQAMQDRGVDISMLHTVDGSSGLAFIMLQPDGENSIILVGGANTSEEWQISDEVTAAIQSAGVVLLQREIPEVVNVIFAKVRFFLYCIAFDKGE